jgi:hypothetical protein
MADAASPGDPVSRRGGPMMLMATAGPGAAEGSAGVSLTEICAADRSVAGHGHSHVMKRPSASGKSLIRSYWRRTFCNFSSRRRLPQCPAESPRRGSPQARLADLRLAGLTAMAAPGHRPVGLSRAFVPNIQPRPPDRVRSAAARTGRPAGLIACWRGKGAYRLRAVIPAARATPCASPRDEILHAPPSLLPDPQQAKRRISQ